MYQCIIIKMFPVDEEYYISLQGSNYHQNHRNSKSLFQFLVNRQKRQQQKPQVKLNKVKKRGKSKYWKQSQNRLYVLFLQENMQQFHRPLVEKIKSRIHVRMSQCIKSKNPKQCRSHHQKMVEKYGDFEKIIQHFLQQSTSEFGRKEVMFDKHLQSYFRMFPLELGQYDEKQESINGYG